MSQPFDFRYFSLHGYRFIEASAGTGKTWSIAALYLRLLLEAEKTVEQILVMSFSNAATEELRLRIAQRLRAAKALLQQQNPTAKDPLDAWLLTLTDKPKALDDLQQALLSFDQAAIQTVHGFCQKQLSRYALSTGAPFEQELEADNQLVQQLLLADFWRSEVQALPYISLELILKKWPTPQKLIEPLQRFIKHPQASIAHWPKDFDWQALPQDLIKHQQRVGRLWQQHGAELSAYLLDGKARLMRRKTIAKAESLTALFEHYLPQTLSTTLCEPPEAFEVLCSGYLQNDKNLKKNGLEVPESEFWQAAQTYWDAYHQWQKNLKLTTLHKAVNYVQNGLQKLRQSSAKRTFDDLVQQFHAALHGPLGEPLSRKLQDEFPVAMIDEFQDTDPLQSQILQRLYPEPHSQQYLLVMIGDPKQAIYRFRGADIFSYFALREPLQAQQLYQLDTNYRSCLNLVEACNRVFALPASHIESAAKLPFTAVKADDLHNQKALKVGTQTQPGVRLILNQNADYVKVESASQWSVEQCARDISERLNSQHSEAWQRDGRPLQASDIAFLVRDKNHALRVQKALQEVGLKSVFISARKVLNSDEAVQLRKLLRSVLYPQDPQAMARALLTPLFALSAPEWRQQQQEGRHAERLARWQQAHERWLQRGLMAMIFPLLSSEAVIPTLLAQAQGERRVTNLLHLLELCAEEESRQDSPAALLHWLEQSSNKEDVNQANQLRLESDSQLIQIVTQHSSKGLEYGVVYIPLLWNQSPKNPAWPYLFHGHNGEACIALDDGESNPAKVSETNELKQEDARLLYVALTRAVSQLVLVYPHNTLKTQQLKRTSASLFCELLWDADGHLREAWQEPNLIQIHPGHAEQPPACVSLADSSAELDYRRMPHRVYPDWRVHSFSSLSRQAHTQEREEQPDHDAINQTTNHPPAEPNAPLRFRFVRGAQAGECLHQLFEQHDFSQAFEPQPIQDTLNRFAIEADALAVAAWLDEVRQTPLIANGFSLAEIPQKHCLVEMEFHFPLPGQGGQKLPSVLQPYFDNEGQSLPTLKGFMQGFIDLMFEYQGRFYVADYKSNHLGDQPVCYQPEALQQAMHEHHYGLQSWIYALALHRFLSLRLPHYEPQQHLGGCFYLFIRGMSPDYAQGNGIEHRTINVDELLELERYLCGGPL